MLEFLEHNNFYITMVEVNKFLLAIVLCGIIGIEREYKNKSAGLKTMIMIGLGSTLFTILSIKIGISSYDRIASNIVTGIGFLGAGVIFKDENKVKGLTTASIIWIVAAIGMAVGSGYFIQAIGVTFVVLLALIIFAYLERFWDKKYRRRTYKIKKQYAINLIKAHDELFVNLNLKVDRVKHQVSNGYITITWDVIGSPEGHDALVNELLKDEKILEFDF